MNLELSGLDYAVVGAYLLAEAIAGASGRVLVPAAGAVLLTLIWAGVYAVWAAPVRLPAPALRLSPIGRTAADGGQP